MKKYLILAIISLVLVSCQPSSKNDDIYDYDNINAAMKLANTHWQTTNSPQSSAFWDNAAYHTANIEAYKLTSDTSYLKYSQTWAEHNNWCGATSTDTSLWKYKPYGETPEYVLFGDWQVCFQTYVDLYKLKPDSTRIARALEVMRYQMSTSNTDYWWWADGLYMAMPAMTKLFTITGDTLFLNKLYQYFSYADSVMFDQTEHLYYRDAKYIYPQHKTQSGKKDFWARGDGWVLAAFAKILQDIPVQWSHRKLFEHRFCQMAETVITLQNPDGYWTRSMLDAEQAPGYETSGTAFFTYALFWGINNGLLPADRFLPSAKLGWNYLRTIALQTDGTVGYVQPIGERAIHGQMVEASSTANFGVGAFVMAACEAARWAKQNNNR